MARKDILPSYLSQPAWRDMCDALDAVFSGLVDIPTNNLGKLRRANPLTSTARQKIDSGRLFTMDDIEYFENEVLIKQINMLGLLVTEHDYFTVTQLVLMLRNVARYWYSKGTGEVADFLSFVLGSKVKFTQMWTQDYVTFLPFGDPGIGTPIYKGGTWYPTTHTTITLTDAPGGIPLPYFAKFAEGLINYPLVPIYEVNSEPIFVSSNTTPFINLELSSLEENWETIGNFPITSAEESAANGDGGFDAIHPIAIAGPGGTGYTYPPAPVASFTSTTPTGPAPLSVTFTLPDSSNAAEVSWDFNSDGRIDSTLRNPTQVFTIPGIYNVSLYVLNASGRDRITANNYVTVT